MVAIISKVVEMPGARLFSEETTKVNDTALLE